jgi:hypothetical protein
MVCLTYSQIAALIGGVFFGCVISGVLSAVWKRGTSNG